MKLPKHILSAAESNKTSIGDNPCLPPEEEQKFIADILEKYFGRISSPFGEGLSESKLRDELNGLISKCKELERNNASALEEICMGCVNELFDIPEDTLEIKCELVDKVESKDERLLPEKTEGFSFDDIEDMNMLTGEIYKRRVLNALVAGASLYYASNFKSYFQKVFDVESELPSLYKKIMQLNNVLLFLTKDKLDEEKSNGGKVDVYISGETDMPKIEAKGVIFPTMFSETIKGILELAISNGLPENREKAMYIIGKSDFKLAELWDMRLGCPLWEIIVEEAEEMGIYIDKAGINFLLMELSMMSVDGFNDTLKEIFAKTKKGKDLLAGILNGIIEEKEEDDFDDFMQSHNNGKYQVNDDDFFDAEELITDSTEGNLY